MVYCHPTKKPVGVMSAWVLYGPEGCAVVSLNNRPTRINRSISQRERELRREGGKSLLAYVKGVDPHLKHIDRPTTIRSPEHRSGWVNYPISHRLTDL